MSVPGERIRRSNDHEVRKDGRYVLYWMTSNRRLRSNFALDRAAEHCKAMDLPLVVLEALRLDYPWASERLHRFVIAGMRDNAQAAATMQGTFYYPYVETKRGAGKGLLAALARDAAVVVGDDFPCFFLPKMQQAASKQLDVRLELVDANGLYPMHATDRVFPSAHTFRRHLQKTLPAHLPATPTIEPLRHVQDAPAVAIDREILERWRATDPESLLDKGIDALEFDLDVPAGAARGGSVEAGKQLERFVRARLSRYADSRNAVSEPAASGLSPYLHFGHIGIHEILHALLEHDGVDRARWIEERAAANVTGSREGWWGLSNNAEAFLDEAVTWREVGYNFASHRDDYDRYDSLPDWAKSTLADHAKDARQTLYDLEQLDAAETHDPVWNAAQRELVTEGRMHNYLRMLWGKKVLEWTRSPRDAADILIELNNRYAVDGRNPNSYSGIFWVLGRYDRAWGPERPIFGKIRYMSSDSTRRKLDLADYLVRYGR
ncbi:MAG: deoxyribodipyrimidine photolyase [Planctomycetes bacterium]|nr:deoxyribodipyrimidine photolyase [Planctomycetota bacterium]MCB9918191.1 deoxyribodipyrimidine photolyase [Planctomycetota bacterium]